MTQPHHDPNPPPPEPVESDDRFPSGLWKGYYQQHGKNTMELTLTFRRGEMRGDGRDGIGPFLIRGRYELSSGKCHWHKQYLGAHDVYYEGFNEGKGIWGVWDLRGWGRGGFHIWPAAWGIGETLRLEEEIDEPAPRITAEAAEELVVGLPGK